MPVDNNMPHGNHFASNGPRPSGTGSSSGGNRRMPAPDTTEAFMMASRSGKTAKPAPAQPVASLGARPSMGGQSSYHQQSNKYQQQSRAYAAGGPAGSPYSTAGVFSMKSCSVFMRYPCLPASSARTMCAVLRRAAGYPR